MKYPCSLIQDLLPLYHDKVCSEESTQIIEQHLRECASCKESYASFCNTDILVSLPPNTDFEMQKAASFRAVRKRLFKKQLLIVALTIVILSITIFSMVAVMKRSTQIIAYENNISVSMIDNSLIGRLKGNQANYLKIKRVEADVKGKENTYLFFYLSGSKWDDMVTGENIVTEYTLCSADKGASEIDSVFYYTGNYTGLENMLAADLQKVIDNSILLWSK